MDTPNRHLHVAEKAALETGSCTACGGKFKMQKVWVVNMKYIEIYLCTMCLEDMLHQIHAIEKGRTTARLGMVADDEVIERAKRGLI
jgi:hypothetical protein